MFGNKLKRATKRVEKAMGVFEQARAGLIVANEEYGAAIEAEAKRIEAAEMKIRESKFKQDQAMKGINSNNIAIEKLTNFLG